MNEWTVWSIYWGRFRHLCYTLDYTHTEIESKRQRPTEERLLTWPHPTQTHQVKKRLFMCLPVTLIVGHKTSKKQIFIAWLKPLFSTHTHHSTFQLSSHERTENSTLPTSCRGQFLNRCSPEALFFFFFQCSGLSVSLGFSHLGFSLLFSSPEAHREPPPHRAWQ